MVLEDVEVMKTVEINNKNVPFYTFVKILWKVAVLYGHHVDSIMNCSIEMLMNVEVIDGDCSSQRDADRMSVELLYYDLYLKYDQIYNLSFHMNSEYKICKHEVNCNHHYKI
jgi:hypothetical protein